MYKSQVINCTGVTSLMEMSVSTTCLSKHLSIIYTYIWFCDYLCITDWTTHTWLSKHLSIIYSYTWLYDYLCIIDCDTHLAFKTPVYYLYLHLALKIPVYYLSLYLAIPTPVHYLLPTHLALKIPAHYLIPTTHTYLALETPVIIYYVLYTCKP